MYSAQVTTEQNGRVRKLAFLSGDTPLSYSQVLALWLNDAEFRNLYIETLAQTLYAGFGRRRR